MCKLCGRAQPVAVHLRGAGTPGKDKFKLHHKTHAGGNATFVSQSTNPRTVQTKLLFPVYISTYDAEEIKEYEETSDTNIWPGLPE